MIYITYDYDDISFEPIKYIKNVWNVNCNNVEEQYIEFMLKKAKEINIVVNPRYLNIMNRENHNFHLNDEVYKLKCKEWKKILKTWHIDIFILIILNGTLEKYKEITNF